MVGFTELERPALTDLLGFAGRLNADGSSASRCKARM